MQVTCVIELIGCKEYRANVRKAPNKRNTWGQGSDVLLSIKKKTGEMNPPQKNYVYDTKYSENRQRHDGAFLHIVNHRTD